MRVFILLLICFPRLLPANTVRDSLNKIWEQPGNPDTIRLKALNDMILDHYMNKIPDSAFYYIQQSQKFAAAHGLPEYVAKALKMMGSFYLSRSKWSNALDYFEQARHIYEEQRDTLGIAAITNSIGLAQARLGHLEIAAEKYFVALKLFERLKNREGIIKVNNNIAGIYKQLKRDEEAISYYRKVLAMLETDGNKRNIAIVLLNIGGILNEIPGREKEGLSYLLRADSLCVQIGDMEMRSTGLLYIGENFSTQGEYEKARTVMREALAIREQLDDSMGIALCNYSIGRTYFQKEDYTAVIPYVLKALNIAREYKDWLLTWKANDMLYKSYEVKGEYHNALEYYKLMRDARDSLNGNETAKALEREQSLYEYEKKETALKTENEKKLLRLKAKSAAETYRKNTWMQLLASLCALLLLLVSFIYNRSRQRKIIADQKANLLKQRLLVSQLNPHFIFNSLNAVQQYIFSQNSHEAGMYLGRFSELMRMILDFSREDFIPVESEIHFIKEYLELQQLRFPSAFRYEIRTDPAVHAAQLHIPPMLAQPFIENAVEHGISRNAANGLIRIRLFFENDKLCYEIEDNGIGLEAAARNDRKNRHRSLATVIVRERLDALQDNGQFYTISVTDKTAAGASGVLVRMTIPYEK